MTSVYVRAEVEGEAPNVRQLWQVQEQGDEKFHVVSMYNGQVLCVSCVAANSKGKARVSPDSYTLSMRILEAVSDFELVGCGFETLPNPK